MRVTIASVVNDAVHVVFDRHAAIPAGEEETVPSAPAGWPEAPCWVTVSVRAIVAGRTTVTLNVRVARLPALSVDEQVTDRLSDGEDRPALRYARHCRRGVDVVGRADRKRDGDPAAAEVVTVMSAGTTITGAVTSRTTTSTWPVAVPPAPSPTT